jgi:hypothetical protein
LSFTGVSLGPADVSHARAISPPLSSLVFREGVKEFVIARARERRGEIFHFLGRFFRFPSSSPCAHAHRPSKKKMRFSFFLVIDLRRVSLSKSQQPLCFVFFVF